MLLGFSAVVAAGVAALFVVMYEETRVYMCCRVGEGESRQGGLHFIQYEPL